MKKFLLTLLILTAIAASNLTAKSYSVTLNAFVPEEVTFEQTADGYQVNSNSLTAEYGFFDAHGNETDAYQAEVFNVVAA
jgi:hypothetical protein